MSGITTSTNDSHVKSRSPDGQGGFAAIIPVGPHIVDSWRAVELIKSLIYWEPELAWCVIIDDSACARGLSELTMLPSTCRAIAVVNPRHGRGVGVRGGLCTGVLTALTWVQQHTDADFVLKIDTDALVIGPFAVAVRSFLAQKKDAGIIGALGLSCNPDVRATEDLNQESKFVTMCRLLPPVVAKSEGRTTQSLEVAGFGRISIVRLCAFNAIRGHIDAAVRGGYISSEYCQGGAYVMSRLLIDRMASAGYLNQQDLWTDLHFSEDRLMPLYAGAVGLKVYDYSRLGEPFGVQAAGLAYPPKELLDRGYSLIHSIKDDPLYREGTIRDFFLARRS